MKDKRYFKLIISMLIISLITLTALCINSIITERNFEMQQDIHDMERNGKLADNAPHVNIWNDNEEIFDKHNHNFLTRPIPNNILTEFDPNSYIEYVKHSLNVPDYINTLPKNIFKLSLTEDIIIPNHITSVPNTFKLGLHQ